MTRQELAAQVRAEFTQGTRTDGTTYWKRDNNAEDWIQKLCWSAHECGNMLPDDYVYEFIVDALDALSEEEEDDDALEALPEEYRTYRLLEWFASHSNRQATSDEKLQELIEVGIAAREATITGAIGWAMREEQQQVFFSVLSSLNDRLEEIEEEEEIDNEGL